jgi:hypothetical protein
MCFLIITYFVQTLYNENVKTKALELYFVHRTLPSLNLFIDNFITNYMFKNNMLGLTFAPYVIENLNMHFALLL